MAYKKTQKLRYTFNGSTQVANWNDLVALQKMESKSLIKLSRLNEVAVTPKPIKRQNVETCLRVFCDNTTAALESHPEIDHQAVTGTSNFIIIIVKFWKIFNVWKIFISREDIAHNDEDRAVFQKPDNQRLQFLMDITAMAENMQPTSCPRFQTFSRDTARFLSHICKGAVDLVRYMLTNGSDYVMLGWLVHLRSFGKSFR